MKALTAYVALWLLIALPFLTDTSCNIAATLLLGGSWLVLALVWFILTPFTFRKAGGWCILAAGIGCAGLLLAFTDIGLIGRLALCESALAEYATQVEPGDKDFDQAPRWVGLFRVTGEENLKGVVLLYTSRVFIDRTGLAYVPPGTPPDDLPPRRMRHLYGSWYWFYWKF